MFEASRRSRMWGTAAADSSLLTVIRTNSDPARASALTCATVPSMSAVSVLVMDCTTIGALPPMVTAPTFTPRDVLREIMPRIIPEMGLNGRPLAIENAVDAGVAQGAVARELVLAQYPIQFRAQTFDGGTALHVEEVGSEFHCDAIQPFERMGQQQQFALGVQGSALYALSIPCGADFHPPIGRVDVHVRRHAHGLPGCRVDDGKCDHRTLLLKFQAPVDLRPHSFRRGNFGVPQSPQLAILHGVDEIVVMRVG